jgi:segregation and condensation protein A
MQEKEDPIPQNEIVNLEDLVKEATWKDLLIDLVKRNKLDPWNIDITVIVDKYIETIHSLKLRDLRIPANIILASSILLKFKSDVLVIDEEEAMDEIRTPRQIVNVDQISFRLRVPPRRRITLTELVSALEEAMRLKEIKTSAAKQMQLETPIKFNNMDIEEETNRLYSLLKQNADASNMLTFTQAIKAANTDNPLIAVFVPLLFLWNKDRVLLLQEKFLEDIIIVLK